MQAAANEQVLVNSSTKTDGEERVALLQIAQGITTQEQVVTPQA